MNSPLTVTSPHSCQVESSINPRLATFTRNRDAPFGGETGSILCDLRFGDDFFLESNIQADTVRIDSMEHSSSFPQGIAR
jgi:hypothetical protein